MAAIEPTKAVEELAAKFHEIYMVEARRQGDVRHKDAYADLSENIKEFDRVLARYVLSLLAAREASYVEMRERLVAIIDRELASENDAKYDMGIYPAAVKGYNDERDYEQRDGFKNGWNAAVSEFCHLRNALLYELRAALQTKPEGTT